MKKILKLSLVLLASFSLGLSSYAGEMTVTGTAKATYNIQSSGGNNGNDNGKGLGVANELAFTASGELENGWTWNYNIALDPDAVASANGAAQNDDTGLSITMPYGTVALNVSQGGLNKSLGFSAAAYKTGIDLGVAAILDPVDLGGYNNIQYHTPAGLLPYGTVFKVGYAPSAATGAAASADAAGTTDQVANDNDNVIAGTADSAGGADFSPESVSDVTEYSLTTTPIDGLTVNASYVDVGSNLTDAVASQYEAGALNAKYAYGPFTIGYGRTLVQPYVAGTTVAAAAERILYLETKDLSIGYAVNENLSVSYETSDSAVKIRATSELGVDTNSENSQDSTTIQAAYTMGGMTLAISQATVDGDGYTKEETGTSRTDVKETILADGNWGEREGRSRRAKALLRVDDKK
jgi:hypothetical protein